GARWLDLKEPTLGSLGRPTLKLIFAIFALDLPQAVQISVAGGELLSWTADLNHRLAAKLPARAYLKLALADCRSSEWQKIAEQISLALVRRSQLILVHYADTAESKSPHWQEVIETSKQLGGQFVLIDTHNKTLGGLLDHYSLAQLEKMVGMAKQLSLGVALAGSLKLEQLPSLSNIGADWLGVRGAVCLDTVRTGELCLDRLQRAMALFAAGSSTKAEHHVVR
ncbi:MAG TPA: (5-formylfuran-3-yl)methyl phosphate synthase, partial [Pirellula sp.]|nr:(5-formylfuran-3-yl)methyl phosphate synthase [Pirellula sp.]